MSRFVSGGTSDQPIERDEAWLKAAQEIEEKHRQKEEEGRQNGGKSLYETLQANKAAKQDAFEEAAKLSNQFRSLDEDEVEFLDSVMESTRAKELAVKKETAAQLELFRRQREETEKAARLERVEESTEQVETWAVKKRKRASQKELPGVKLRKSSSTGSNISGVTRPEHSANPPVGETQRDPVLESSTSASKSDVEVRPPSQESSPVLPQPPKSAIEKPAPSVALGLGDYSDSD